MSKLTTTLFGPLAFLPYPAEAPLTERLRWRTDVMSSRNGGEQRVQSRNAPRQEFSYIVPQQPEQRRNAFHTEWGALRERWAIPVWSQAQALGTVSAGLLTLSCDTANFELRADSLALLFTSPTDYQVIQLSAASGGSITFTPATTARANAFLIPIRVGFLAGPVGRVGNGSSARSRYSFEVEDNEELVPSAPAQYLSEDIYYEPGLMDGDTYEVTIDSPVDRTDFELGLVDRYVPWTYNRMLTGYSMLATTPAEFQALREFVYRRAGRYRAFWQPSWEVDLKPVSTGTVTTTLDVAADALLDWATARTHLAIEDDAGTWYPRAISAGSALSSTVTRLTLSSSLGLAASRIRRVSFLGLKRLANDDVEIEHLGAGVARFKFSVVELTP